MNGKRLPKKAIWGRIPSVVVKRKEKVFLEKPLIGFVGQGYVGKNYADNFAKRGFPIVRYSLEPKYRGNRDKIK